MPVEEQSFVSAKYSLGVKSMAHWDSIILPSTQQWPATVGVQATEGEVDPPFVSLFAAEVHQGQNYAVPKACITGARVMLQC